MLLTDTRTSAVCTVATAVEAVLERRERSRDDMLGRLISMLRENEAITDVQLDELLMWRYTEVWGG